MWLNSNGTYALRRGNSISLAFAIRQSKMNSVVFSNRGFTISMSTSDLVYTEDSSKKFTVGFSKITAHDDYNEIDENNATNNKIVDIEAKGSGITVKYNGYCDSKSAAINLADASVSWNVLGNAPIGIYQGDIVITITEGISYN